MKPPGKPAEETLSEQEKLKAAEKKPRADSVKSESHDEKVIKEKPKTDSESHADTDDGKDHKGGRGKQQQVVKQQQQQPASVAPGKSSAPAKPAVVPAASAPKSAAPAIVGVQTKPVNQQQQQQQPARPNALPQPEPTAIAAAAAVNLQQQPQPTIQDKLSINSNNTSKTDNSKQLLDGATPPVNTIIFENTNYKSSTAAAVTVTEEVFKAATGVSVPGSMHEMMEAQAQAQQQQQQQRPPSANGPPQQVPPPQQQQQQQQQLPQQQQPNSQADAITSALQGMTFQKPTTEAD
uniref:Uncharacterized protein n=2 Tax=Culex quinquefasciatus TaxID=7176 RepID=A0A1S4K219_CULQU